MDRTHCKHGHEWVPKNIYTYPNGRQKCRECARVCLRRWKRQNPKKVKEDQKNYTTNNREKEQERFRSYYEANATKIKEKHSLYRNTNRNEIKQRDAVYYEANKKNRQAYSAAWKKSNPGKVKQMKHSRRARKLNQLGTVSSDIEILLFREQEGKCFYCGSCLVEYGHHQEHKIPLSRGGFHEDKNLCLSCPPCNLKKGSKTDSEFIVGRN